jgi:2-oxoglutarate dehydrogenase E2 component (dihydrolipoamide succinyltransferase)
MAIVEMKVPTIGESVTEVTLSQWLVESGSYIKIDQPICEFESDKATLEFPAEAAGLITHVAAEGDDIEIGGLVATIDTSAAAPAETATPAENVPAKKTTVAAPETTSTHATGHPSPAAAKVMRENDLTSAQVPGTGKDGRITKQDAVTASQSKPSSTPKKAAEPMNVSAPIEAFSRNSRREKMSRMRRTIASRLVEAKNNTAMLTTFNEVDLTNIMALRKKYQERFVEKYGIKLGFMSLFAKACAKVLMEMPQVNAQIDEKEVIYHDYVDISIAISTDNGLVVPPVHNVESLHFSDIEKQIKHLATKAREGTLTLEEMKGGTFTITNGGIFGSMMSTPILNRPQSAILGMHTIKKRPIAVDGEVKIRPMMYLALSYDHRIIDGSSSVTFLVKVIKLLEDPTTLLLDL